MRGSVHDVFASPTSTSSGQAPLGVLGTGCSWLRIGYRAKQYHPNPVIASDEGAKQSPPPNVIASNEGAKQSPLLHVMRLL
jgi:hypothetical protein